MAYVKLNFKYFLFLDIFRFNTLFSKYLRVPKLQDCLDSCQPLPITKYKSIGGIGQNTTKFDRIPIPIPEKKADTTDTDTIGISCKRFPLHLLTLRLESLKFLVLRLLSIHQQFVVCQGKLLTSNTPIKPCSH